MRVPETKPNLSVQPHRILSIFSIISILMYAALAAWSFVIYFSSGAQQFSLINAIIFLGAFIVDSLFFLVFRKSRPYLLAWVVLVTLLVVGVSPSIFYSGIGLVAYFGAFALAFLVASFVLPGQLSNRFVFIGLVGLVCAFLLDTFGPVNRRMVLLPSVASGIAIVILLVLILVLFLRFQEFPFRSKVVYAIVFVAGLSIVAITVISGNLFSQSLNTAGFQSLGLAARMISYTLDDFIWVTASAVEAEAQITLFRELLGAPQPASAVDLEAQEFVNGLASRGDIINAGKNYQGYLEAYLLLDQSGKVILDSERLAIGEDHSKKDYYLQSIGKPTPYVSPVIISEDGSSDIFFSAQVRDSSKAAAGVLVARYNASILQQILLESNNQVGEQSYAILVDEYGMRLAQGNALSTMHKLIVPQESDIVDMLRQQRRLSDEFDVIDSNDTPDLGRQLQLKSSSSTISFQSGKLSDGPLYLAATEFMRAMPWTVIYIQSQNMLHRPVLEQIRIVQSLGMFIGAVAVVLAFGISRRLAHPIVELTEIAAAMTSGNLSNRAIVRSSDELGKLAKALNGLAERLQQSLLGMEHEVEERTRDLEKRSRQLQAAAEVGRAVSTIRDLGELLDRSTRLISERFNYYHVGIFLVDEAGRFAVLRAANSEGGKRMLARSHRLAVGQQGIVGFVTSTGKPRIALDVGADAVFFNNPDLPSTRSEMALPLISGDRILGALDVQSTEAGAFSNEDVSVLQVLADLLAVALENARLLIESQNALESIRRAYGEVSRRSWVERLADTTGIGFSSLDSGIVPLGEKPRLAEQSKVETLSLPIYIREVIIGYVEAFKPVERGAWSEDEKETIKTLVDQLGVALESARLYESSQIQAERERLVSEFTARLQENLDVDAVLRSAAAEMRKMLGLKDVTIVLGEDGENEPA